MTARTVSRIELEQQGRAIVEQLGGKWSLRGGMCRCPAHDDGSPSLSIRVGDTTLLVHCFAGCNSVDVLKAIRTIDTGGVRTTHEARQAEPKNLQPLAERLWATSRPLSGTLAARYLASRHLVSHSAQLRYHPRVQLGRTADATFHPAMIGAVRDDAGLVAVHRTFLDGATARQAKFDNPKRLLAVPETGAVRIGAATRVLGIAEGIETALAANQLRYPGMGGARQRTIRHRVDTALRRTPRHTRRQRRRRRTRRAAGTGRTSTRRADDRGRVAAGTAQ